MRAGGQFKERLGISDHGQQTVAQYQHFWLLVQPKRWPAAVTPFSLTVCELALYTFVRYVPTYW